MAACSRKPPAGASPGHPDHPDHPGRAGAPAPARARVAPGVRSERCAARPEHDALGQRKLRRVFTPFVSSAPVWLDYDVTGFNDMVNCGSQRLCFPTPAPARCRIHARCQAKAAKAAKAAAAVKSGEPMTLERNIRFAGPVRALVINDLAILCM